MEQILNVPNLQVLSLSLNDYSFQKAVESLALGEGRFW